MNEKNYFVTPQPIFFTNIGQCFGALHQPGVIGCFKRRSHVPQHSQQKELFLVKLEFIKAKRTNAGNAGRNKWR